MPFEIVANCQVSGKILPVCKMQVEILAGFFIPLSSIRILKIVPVITCRHPNFLVGCVQQLCSHYNEPRYNEGPGTDDICSVRYDEVSLYRVSIPYILLLLGRGISFVIPRTSLYN